MWSHHLRHQLHSLQPRLLVEAAVRAGQLKKFGELSMISIGQEELIPIQRFHKMNGCIYGFQKKPTTRIDSKGLEAFGNMSFILHYISTFYISNISM